LEQDPQTMPQIQQQEDSFLCWGTTPQVFESITLLERQSKDDFENHSRLNSREFLSMMSFHFSMSLHCSDMIVFSLP
jgi:hypothetical protein